MSENIFEKAKSSAEALKDKVSDLSNSLFDDEKKEIIDEYKNITSEKLKSNLETLGNYTELFSEAGYELSSINASIALPPDISITFKCLNAIPVTERNDILSKVQDSKITAMILKSLFKASDYSESIKIGEFKLRSINIKMGLIPSISVSFS